MSPPDHAAAHGVDFRNRLAEAVFLPLGVPLLRVANATRSEWRAHVGLQFRADNEHQQQSDCTHYCSPSGALMLWRELLYNALLVL